MPQEFESLATEQSSLRVETPAGSYAQRVTPDEFAAALVALEGHAPLPAHVMNGTLSIGQTVDEMGLSVPPEDIWREVQKQRLQQTNSSAAPPSHAQNNVSDMPHAARRGIRWGQWAAVLTATVIIARLLTGHGLVSVSNSTQIVNPGKTLVSTSVKTVSGIVPLGSIIIKNDTLTRVIHAEGKTILANGNHDALTIEGDCKQLIVTGDTNTVRVRGSVQTLVLTGDHNIVTYPSPPNTLTRVDTGIGNVFHGQ